MARAADDIRDVDDDLASRAADTARFAAGSNYHRLLGRCCFSNSRERGRCWRRYFRR